MIGEHIDKSIVSNVPDLTLKNVAESSFNMMRCLSSIKFNSSLPRASLEFEPQTVLWELKSPTRTNGFYCHDLIVCIDSDSFIWYLCLGGSRTLHLHTLFPVLNVFPEERCTPDYALG
ncbi:uncharacterized protein LOC116170227 [Photinus pyralis]|uniref:uncharacterized protein LOC116170227 n=1 Tax=Photinus pyralis TaxID=7054 RepID=UPI0012671389|nr:uncharacterized protein LOC116170227 [Photinus pyralis]